ncbi:hypothetical protein EOD39_18424 [Acipenser ruthenus]|uniref:Uncharacterized protein n=1 Tax=Acipenser ruthenus TaxID=7906 RepID=A0A444V0Y4_ACIRT|nr:hypothetical protein EOD39_18424 [Acipenser ruthenus]
MQTVKGFNYECATMNTFATEREARWPCCLNGLISRVEKKDRSQDRVFPERRICVFNPWAGFKCSRWEEQAWD